MGKRLPHLAISIWLLMSVLRALAAVTFDPMPFEDGSSFIVVWSPTTGAVHVRPTPGSKLKSGENIPPEQYYRRNDGHIELLRNLKSLHGDWVGGSFMVSKGHLIPSFYARTINPEGHAKGTYGMIPRVLQEGFLAALEKNTGLKVNRESVECRRQYSSMR